MFPEIGAKAVSRQSAKSFDYDTNDNLRPVSPSRPRSPLVSDQPNKQRREKWKEKLENRGRFPNCQNLTLTYSNFFPSQLIKKNIPKRRCVLSFSEHSELKMNPQLLRSFRPLWGQWYKRRTLILHKKVSCTEAFDFTSAVDLDLINTRLYPRVCTKKKNPPSHLRPHVRDSRCANLATPTEKIRPVNPRGMIDDGHFEKECISHLEVIKR